MTVETCFICSKLYMRCMLHLFYLLFFFLLSSSVISFLIKFSMSKIKLSFQMCSGQALLTYPVGLSYFIFLLFFASSCKISLGTSNLVSYEKCWCSTAYCFKFLSWEHGICLHMLTNVQNLWWDLQQKRRMTNVEDAKTDLCLNVCTQWKCVVRMKINFDVSCVLQWMQAIKYSAHHWQALFLRSPVKSAQVKGKQTSARWQCCARH